MRLILLWLIAAKKLLKKDNKFTIAMEEEQITSCYLSKHYFIKLYIVMDLQ